MSMTGYGKGEKVIVGKKIVVEIRSLNGKGLDLSVKMPYGYRQKEMEMRSIVSKSLIRGKVEVMVNVDTDVTSAVTPINKTAFKNFFCQLEDISKDVNININEQSIISTILRMPEVMQSEKKEIEDTEWDALFEALNEAIVNINSFRAQEGNVLITDLLGRLFLIEGYKELIPQYEAVRVETVRNRIFEALGSLKIEFDSSRLEQEMIFYIEKLDITEEKVRLQNHINYFKEVAEEQAPGKKFGFISQEIGREINTIGSKANHIEIQKLVVKMKDELEKIKEQSLNIL